MAGPCDQRNPLVRAGRTQRQRDLAELAPDHFRIDERDLADLVLFAQRFARHIRYYDPSNTAAGDWTAFFASDVTATLAALAKLPVENVRAAQIDVEGFLKAEPGRPAADLSNHFKLLFHMPVALVERAAAHHARLGRDDPMWRTVRRIVEAELGTTLASLVAYYKGATGSPVPVLDDTALAPGDYNLGGLPPTDPRPRLSDTVADLLLDRPALSALAVPPATIEPIAPTGWPAFFAAQAADPAPYQDGAGTYERIYDALTYNLLVTSVEQVLRAVARIRREAASALAASLTDFGAHTPHYGLWLAFLQIFEVARDDLNRLTGRHLDFYYREVLRLSARGPVPDRAHVLFELSKTADAHLVRAGTEFRAGKDDTGAPVAYRLDEDIVVNRAKVAALKACRVHTETVAGQPRQTVYAAAVANSRDGQGEEDLPEDAPAWPPFGPDPLPPGAAADAPQLAFGRIGFAISDRQLFLREGGRLIWFRATFASPLPNLPPPPKLRARLTAEDGWLEIEGAFRVAAFIAAGHVDIWVLLNGDDPAIVPYAADVHDPGYATDAPVLEIVFGFAAADDDTARAYALLRDVGVAKLELLTWVAGLRQLSIQADGGVVDPAKPFAAFGPQPKPGAALVIGSSEIFSRRLHALWFDIGWEGVYLANTHFYKTAPADYGASVDFLSNGAWTAGTGGKADLNIDSFQTSLGIPGISSVDGKAPQSLENPGYSTRARSGFLRLRLDRSFGHGAYVDEKTRALVILAKGSGTYAPTDINVANGLPLEPYTPTMTSIVANYVSAVAAPAQFLHLHPFGIAAAANGRLLPEIDFEGALYIGVKGFGPPARLTLLLQVADGSGDPLLEVPDLAFHYLAGDDWRAFKDQAVDDKSNGLTGSGVLGLAVPEEADTAHTILPEGLHWFRISAADNIAAVNSLLTVDAQAARVTFADRGNDPRFLETPLAPGTIARLQVPDPAIRKVAQPYASFGGRGAEEEGAFRRRASERLRHKDRASTMWDYEQLVLEAFPQLYRVKCLNHTELVRQGGVVVADNELQPGAVVVVAVPFTEGRPHIDPLRPYVDQATLKAIERLLAKRMSPFVRLEAQNPKFEEVHVKFDVAFNDDVADIAFYRDELKKEIVRFLTPWQWGAGEIAFGGRLWKSSIIDFVEERPYVHFVENFEMYHKPDAWLPEGAWTPIDTEVIDASTARSILVSARDHTVNEVV